jgi:hypothetical protein
MGRRPSSLTLPRMDDGAHRVLRIRADERLGEMLIAGQPGEAARLEVPSRETVATGERITVEVGFGALADEVELAGECVAVRPQAEGSPHLVVIAIDRRCARQIAYVRQVLAGLRPASARAHRRVPVDVSVRWRSGELRQVTRARDLSRGGAFILSSLLPPVGSLISIEIDRAGAEPLALEAQVSWLRKEGPETGFGVQFRVRSRKLADALHQFVRSHERAEDGDRPPAGRSGSRGS